MKALRETVTNATPPSNRASELCCSATPPPGFYSGRRYHILVSELEEYMKDLARRKKTINL